MDKQYVRMDEHGVYRVGKTRVMLDGIVSAFNAGCDAEAIVHRYPALSVDDASGAIAFYQANKGQVEAYLKRQHELWEKLRAEQDAKPAPVIQRLREIKKAQISLLIHIKNLLSEAQQNKLTELRQKPS